MGPACEDLGAVLRPSRRSTTTLDRDPFQLVSAVIAPASTTMAAAQSSAILVPAGEWIGQKMLPTGWRARKIRIHRGWTRIIDRPFHRECNRVSR